MNEDERQTAAINLELAKVKALFAGGCALIALPFLLVFLAASLFVLYLLLRAIF